VILGISSLRFTPGQDGVAGRKEPNLRAQGALDRAGGHNPRCGVQTRILREEAAKLRSVLAYPDLFHAAVIQDVRRMCRINAGLKRSWE
jgi:hypothetical protein